MAEELSIMINENDTMIKNKSLLVFLLSMIEMLTDEKKPNKTE